MALHPGHLVLKPLLPQISLEPICLVPLPFSQALKVTAHLQRAAANAGEGPKFVWTKKVEKELVGGTRVKELSAFCDKERHVERLVSGHSHCMFYAGWCFWKRHA